MYTVSHGMWSKRVPHVFCDDVHTESTDCTVKYVTDSVWTQRSHGISEEILMLRLSLKGRCGDSRAMPLPQPLREESAQLIKMFPVRDTKKEPKPSAMLFQSHSVPGQARPSKARKQRS